MQNVFMDFILANKEILFFIGETVIKTFVFLNGIMAFTALLTLGERKISALMQDRVGPNRASIFGFSFYGLFHPAADGIKLLMKEDFIPEKANKFFFTLAPLIGLISVLTCFAFIPFGNQIELFGRTIKFVIADIDASVFLLLAISSIAIYSAFMAGYFSGNNFALLSALRAAAQMISYEVVLGLSLVPMLMIYSTATISEIPLKQGEFLFSIIPAWGIILQPFAFLIFLTAAIAENKRTPFDVVEGESEILGYFLEYSSMRFGSFMFAEFIEIILVSMLAITFFFGGWQIPYLTQEGLTVPGIFNLHIHHLIISALQLAAFALKTALFSLLLLIIRWTLPRFRFDQIMKLCWQFLLPLAIANILLTAFILRQL